ncbi:hypothetical protein ACFLZK_02125 [Patescibacteria group bacterium]
MNMGSILVCGSNAQKRKEKVNELISKVDENLLKDDHPDKLSLGLLEKKKNISIVQIRKLIQFLTTKPYSSKNKVVVISQAEKMTTQAQNALLKILEEPPFFAIIILSSKTEQALLPTVLSRCRKIKADYNGDEVFVDNEDVTHFNEVLGYDVGRKLKLAETLAKKDDDFVIDLLEFWIREERFEMTVNEKFEKHNNIEILLRFLEDIENTNVNVRLALETLFMHV